METLPYTLAMRYCEDRAGAAVLSLIISERLDPRIRLLLVIQFTRREREAIINGELILIRTGDGCASLLLVALVHI